MKSAQATNQKIHTRQIDIATYRGNTPDAFIVEGILKDERLLDTFGPAGKFYPAGTIHHMIVRITVKALTLVIEDIEVEMPTIPHQMCIDTLKCLDPVKGLAIVSGFTSSVKKLVGGVKGCVHLLALLTAMAPAAFQGVFSAIGKDLDPSHTAEKMKDTCRVWREDGPLMEQLTRSMKKKH